MGELFQKFTCRLQMVYFSKTNDFFELGFLAIEMALNLSKYVFREFKKKLVLIFFLAL